MLHGYSDGMVLFMLYILRWHVLGMIGCWRWAYRCWHCFARVYVTMRNT